MQATPAPRHPAKYSAAIMPAIHAAVLKHYSPRKATLQHYPPRKGKPIILDPFAGTGRIHAIFEGTAYRTIGIEIEPEWAALHPRTRVGNALALPFKAATIDVIVTSPAYGNRLADHHNAQDASRRNSYRHNLGRPLHPDNAGALQWGEAYRAFHYRAWAEASRVLRPRGVFVLNVSNHIRKGAVVDVTGFHVDALQGLGFTLLETISVPTPRLRYGANGAARVEAEAVIVFRKDGARQRVLQIRKIGC